MQDFRMNLSEELLAKAEQHVVKLLSENLASWAVYHNFDHTEEVVRAAEEIAKGEELTKSETELVTLAALFHDAGYATTVDGHEEKSAQLAAEFLKANDYPQEKIDKVVGCILATKVPQHPKNHLEEILCDADLFHLGKKRFFDRSDLLRMEIELRTGKPFSNVEWLQKNIEFASQGTFHTTYAKEEFTARRIKNLATLQEQLREVLARNEKTSVKEQTKKEKVVAKVEKEKKPERGIETMFRVVPKNHLDLSALADQKASILISTSSIILSIIFGLLVTKIDTHPFILFPTSILALVCLTTIVFAILATRPNVTTGTFTRDDVRQRKTNLLFFGNFHSSSLDDFDWGMREMMNDADYLYGSMIKDLYFLGKVLGVKYKYLRIAYTIFMWGLIVSVIAFGIAIATAPPPVPLPVQ
jgi:predicted metal-dependent HD superfamily phosphohydrolase